MWKLEAIKLVTYLLFAFCLFGMIAAKHQEDTNNVIIYGVIAIINLIIFYRISE